MSDNLIKQTCKELNLTYKQLGEMIGLSEASIKRLAVADSLNSQVVKSLEMLNELHRLKQTLASLNSLKTHLEKSLEIINNIK